MSLTYSDKELAIREELANTMDIHPDATSHYRTYPSIRDYYEGNRKNKEKPMQLQKGLSNFSRLQLGDDRISFNESILSATYRIPVEEKMTISSPSKNKTKHSRMRDYKDATDAVGEVELDRLERVMKDKLFQRSYATSSPFQVRKAFKFFDREKTLRISIEGFISALEFLGFQFGDLQNLAMFARYDPHYNGVIDYMHFINFAMFYSPFASDAENAPPPKPSSLLKLKQSKADPTTAKPQAAKAAQKTEAAGGGVSLYQVPDVDEEELKQMQHAELRRIFTKVDVTGNNTVSRDQFEILLMALGLTLTPLELDEFYSRDLGIPEGELLPFDLFCEWWTSDVGAAMKINTQ
jgi:Ca2+-binding EF-hand superfamily protein